MNQRDTFSGSSDLDCHHGVSLQAWCVTCEIEADQMNPLFKGPK